MSFAFIPALWRRLRPLPCSLACRLHCTGPTNARQSQWETEYPVRVVRCSWSAWAAHCQRCCLRLSHGGGIVDLGFLLAPNAVVTGVLALGHETVCFVSLELDALVLSLRLFFVKNLLSSWWTSVDVALSLILARLLLRGCCPLVPRSLPPVLCGGGAGLGLTRVCSPGHITAYDLETGPWALLPRSSPAICCLPMGWPGWGFVYVSTI